MRWVTFDCTVRSASAALVMPPAWAAAVKMARSPASMRVPIIKSDGKPHDKPFFMNGGQAYPAGHQEFSRRRSMTNSALLRRLGIELPIVQAPMGGGPSTPELVAAVSNAGGLGSLGAPYLTPAQIHEAVHR